jgi:putative ABC transport system ATP-binding protein
MGPNNVLSVNALEKRYGLKENEFSALSEVSFTVETGEFIGIMGSSGAGKSTLLNLIATIDKPSSGHIAIDGKDITGLKEIELADFRRKKLGFVFQDYNLLPNLTSEENISLPLVLAKEKTSVRRKKLKELASILNIENILGKHPSSLSGGQKQRVAAARAMINSPVLLLADEPTGALDSNSGRELLEYFVKLNAERQATIIMVTHDCFAASFSSRILFLKDGRLTSEIARKGASRQAFYDRLAAVALPREA